MVLATLASVSRTLAKVEIHTAAALAAAVTALVLLNVVTGTAGVAIFWVDEAAIYAMIWMAFIATSAAFANRSAIAVTLVFELVPERVGRIFRTIIDVFVLIFAASMGVMTWLWFDPAGLIAAGFDVGAFQMATFNFIYAEPTSTLGISKVWIWAIVPIFVVTTSIHALANLLAGQASAAPAGEAAAEAPK
ncbi:MAG: TRAP transporter small permease [Devosiaceae bacterium]|nr:TRAP transporter small permease [Devosiaceae bacterium MH13]